MNLMNVFSKLFDSNDKQLSRIKPLIKQILDLEDKYIQMTDEKLLEEADRLRDLIGYKRMTQMDILSYSINDESTKRDSAENRRIKAKLKEVLPEAFALVREASSRFANHKHFEVQIVAGYFLFENKIVELFTGEGKTLAANLPLFLYSLTGKGAHLVTVNDYLARRDAEWNGHILHKLGVSVGVVNNNAQYRYISDEEVVNVKGEEGKKLIEEREKKAKDEGRLKYGHMNGSNLLPCSKEEAYSCDIVYGTNNEFGFDYLRDNMARTDSQRVQGVLHYAIVDEADSILIDEARTPLIISESAEAPTDMYYKFASSIKKLNPQEDCIIDEKYRSVVLKEEAVDKVEKMLGIKNIYDDPANAYHLDNALKAEFLFKLDKDYIIRNGEIMIVDEFTGRVLEGRRYSEGLHQAIEAKEGVEIKRESRTAATITLQNYFRLYSFISGMTGTALTEAEEFARIYNLDVIVVPTNKPVVRKDNPDILFATQKGKFNAVVEDIIAHVDKGQPVLVGTTSVANSEILSNLLSKKGVKHNVLNAKQHEMESKIVAQAGNRGSVTIATNMAGRGTDIALGEGVKELGGLYIIGTERHESRRVDNQLRGRSGRQGDPGESQFYISFEDDLLRIFGGDMMKNLVQKIDSNDYTPIVSSLFTRAVESAQKKVEAYNFDIRKNLVEYDDVLNQQREIIYSLRRQLLFIVREYRERTKELDLMKKHYSQQDVEKVIKDIEYNSLFDSIRNYTLSRADDSIKNDARMIEIIKPYNSDLFLYILKMIAKYIDSSISIAVKSEGEITQDEELVILESLRTVMGEDLMSKTTELLGIDIVTFIRELSKKKSYEKTQDLFRIVCAGYIYHLLQFEPAITFEVLKDILFDAIDYSWANHLTVMKHLQEGMRLRQSSQPLVMYKNEGFQAFEESFREIENLVVSRIMRVKVVRE